MRVSPNKTYGVLGSKQNAIKKKFHDKKHLFLLCSIEALQHIWKCHHHWLNSFFLIGKNSILLIKKEDLCLMMMNTKDHKNTNKSNALREPSLISLYIYIYIYHKQWQFYAKKYNPSSWRIRNMTLFFLLLEIGLHIAQGRQERHAKMLFDEN